jgi:hypothetical protein
LVNTHPSNRVCLVSNSNWLACYPQEPSAHRRRRRTCATTAAARTDTSRVTAPTRRCRSATTVGPGKVTSPATARSPRTTTQRSATTAVCTITLIPLCPSTTHPHPQLNCAGTVGHIARDCTGTTTADKCYTCGKPGHISRECRLNQGTAMNTGGDGAAPAMECYNCGSSPPHCFVCLRPRLRPLTFVLYEFTNLPQS